MKDFKVYAGIDYSMTSPAICIHTGSDTWSISNCFFYFIAQNKKQVLHTDRIDGDLLPEYTSQQQRFRYLSDKSISILDKHKAEKIYMEGYSYGSSGVVFQIGENTGVLKNDMYRNDYKFSEPVPPTTIKKFATGKGTADKLKMCESFLLEPGVENFPQFMAMGKGKSPLADMIDAYFICKYGYFLENELF